MEQAKLNKKEQLTFFRIFLYAKVNFSDKKDVSSSSKNSNLHAKLLKIG